MGLSFAAQLKRMAIAPRCVCLTLNA